MSKVFYDHLLEFDKLEKELKKHVKSSEEREEIYGIIDEIVHHRVVGCILDRLPKDHHKEFIRKFSDKPHDTNLFLYLKDKITDDVEHFLREEIYIIGEELLQMIRPTENKRSDG